MLVLKRCFALFVLTIIGNSNLAFASEAPNIDEISFGDQYSNCFSGASFYVKTDDMASDVELQFFESLNGKDYFIYRKQERPLRGSSSWYEFKCPQSSFESKFQIRLINSTHAGNSMYINYSTGPIPHIDDVDYRSGVVNLIGYYLDGQVEVIYDGVSRGYIYGNRNRLTIPATIHKNYAGLYSLKNVHGISNSFMVFPYTKANFGFVTSPGLLHGNELRNNCKNFYSQNVQMKVESAQGVCSLNNAYAFWGIVDQNVEDDDAEVFLNIADQQSSVIAVSPSGYGSRVELVVGIDSYQLQHYPKYLKQAIETGDLKISVTGGYSLEAVHYVPIYKGVYLGEPRMVMDANTSVAAHIALDYFDVEHKPEIIGNIYKQALSSPLIGQAAARYNQLMTQTLVVNYNGRLSSHRVASPLYVEDQNLNSLISSIASQIQIPE
jgi:hypothetical protein